MRGRWIFLKIQGPNWRCVILPLYPCILHIYDVSFLVCGLNHSRLPSQTLRSWLLGPIIPYNFVWKGWNPNSKNATQLERNTKKSSGIGIGSPYPMLNLSLGGFPARGVHLSRASLICFTETGRRNRQMFSIVPQILGNCPMQAGWCKCLPWKSGGSHQYQLIPMFHFFN